MNALSILHQAMNKQSTGVSAAFKDAIKPSINKVIEIKRAEVGSNLFKAKEKSS